VRSRLIRELEVIRKWSLSPYFLLVLDIVEEARRAAGISRGGARVGGELDGDVLPGNFACVPAALGSLLRTVFERAARRLPGH